MEYAVIETGGKQYKVTPGLTFDVESLGDDANNSTFDKVLLYVSDGAVTLGKPYIPGAEVSVKILGAKKGEKIYVSKFKAKSRHRRTMGHRQALTSVEVVSIKNEAKTVSSKKTSKKT